MMPHSKYRMQLIGKKSINFRNRKSRACPRILFPYLQPALNLEELSSSNIAYFTIDLETKIKTPVKPCNSISVLTSDPLVNQIQVII